MRPYDNTTRIHDTNGYDGFLKKLILLSCDPQHSVKAYGAFLRHKSYRTSVMYTSG